MEGRAARKVNPEAAGRGVVLFPFYLTPLLHILMLLYCVLYSLSNGLSRTTSGRKNEYSTAKGIKLAVHGFMFSSKLNGRSPIAVMSLKKVSTCRRIKKDHK